MLSHSGESIMFGKFLRIAGILLLAITAVITFLSGIGTTCVALDPVKYDMAEIAPYQWLYLFYVIAGIIIGIMGILAVIALIRRKPNAYRNTIIVLLLGSVVGGLHMATSRALRGKSMPLDFIVYTTIFTLILFLIFRIPGIWNKINLTGDDDSTTQLGVGVSMFVTGIVILTVQIWAGPTHVIDGINYADAWHTQMMVVGGALTILGGSLLLGIIVDNILPHPFQKFKTESARIIK